MLNIEWQRLINMMKDDMDIGHWTKGQSKEWWQTKTEVWYVLLKWFLETDFFWFTVGFALLALHKKIDISWRAADKEKKRALLSCFLHYRGIFADSHKQLSTEWCILPPLSNFCWHYCQLVYYWNVMVRRVQDPFNNLTNPSISLDSYNICDLTC